MSDSAGRRILIVDDEVDMRRTLRRIMRAKGYSVAVAANGPEAIEIARKFQPQILLMDMRMPGMNGVEAYRQIKPLCPSAVVVFMTAFSTIELSQEAMDEGALDVMAKPLDVDNVCQVLGQTLPQRPVLVVDDDAGFRTSLQRALSTSGFHVMTAVGLADAIETYRRHPDCVVLLDMKLDDLSGLHVLEQLQLVNSDVIAVLMTGFTELKPKMQIGLHSGARSTFIKPFDVGQMAAEIRKQIVMQK